MSLMKSSAPLMRPVLPAAMQPSSLLNQQFKMFSIARTKGKETLREREDRRRELSKLMESWQCTVGFEFHVQMNTKHKMFSSKSFSPLTIRTMSRVSNTGDTELNSFSKHVD